MRGAGRFAAHTLASGVAALVATSCNCANDATSTPVRPQAVVLITIDTLRADAVSFVEGGPPTTPYLGSLAAKGIVYERAYAPSSWTAPSMASLFTGLEPAAHGVVRGSVGRARGDGAPAVHNQARLAASLQTLAESLGDAGYTTVGIAANRHLAAHLGFAQGFDAYDRQAAFAQAADVNGKVFRKLAKVFGNDWETSWKRRPTFLWVHYFDPHAPYEAREPWATEFGSKPNDPKAGIEMPKLIEQFGDVFDDARVELEPLYRSEVRYTDQHIAALGRRLGFDDPDILLIVTSDHGEEFGEHGRLGHGQALYEESVRVPLFVRWPKGFPQAGVRIDEPVSLLDVLPSVRAWLQLDDESEVHGRPLPTSVSHEPPQPRLLFLESRRARPRVRAVIDEQTKLIKRDYRNRVMRERHRWELYDLGADPGETTNLGGAQAATAKRLEDHLRDHARRQPTPPTDGGSVEVTDPALSERLRALGYED